MKVYIIRMYDNQNQFLFLFQIVDEHLLSDSIDIVSVAYQFVSFYSDIILIIHTPRKQKLELLFHSLQQYYTMF